MSNQYKQTVIGEPKAAGACAYGVDLRDVLDTVI